MKSAVSAFVSLLAVGLVLFDLESARQDLTHALPPPPAASSVLAEPVSATATEVTPPQSPRAAQAQETSAATYPQVRAQQASAARFPDRRRFRRRSRNRYPGPIPTPADWEPPEGRVRIGLQAGHWRADEGPRELSGLRDNGTAWQGTAEWESNLEIARSAGALLGQMGYEVDILPAVVPPNYRAHLFIAIHADGSNDSDASGIPRGRAPAGRDRPCVSLREAAGTQLRRSHEP